MKPLLREAVSFREKLSNIIHRVLIFTDILIYASIGTGSRLKTTFFIRNLFESIRTHTSYFRLFANCQEQNPEKNEWCQGNINQLKPVINKYPPSVKQGLMAWKLIRHISSEIDCTNNQKILINQIVIRSPDGSALHAILKKNLVQDRGGGKI